MAASLSRPDPSSPASVAEAGFSTSRRGYSQDEVRAFLTSVAAELGRLQERERQLEARLEQVEAEVVVTPELDEETVAAILGEETLRVLQTARESASQIKIRAEEAAAKVISDANDEINRVRQEAEVESARKRHDATSDAEAEVALAKQQGREMVNEARAYRERVLADLERRTKLARQQIEDLVHGRDRLLQVFERARLVAVDVTTELQSIDGPDEIVNLAPTTGPLPLMVPASDLDRAAAAEHAGDRMADAVDGSAHRHEEVASLQESPVADAASDEHDAATSAHGDAPDAEAVEAHADDVMVDDTAAPTDPDAEIDADDDTEIDEAADGDIDADDGAPETEPVVSLPRDANVVSLFRDRPTEPPDGTAVAATDGTADDATDDATDGTDGTAEDATDDATDGTAEDATDDADRPDVNGIFERLRSETPDDATSADVAGARDVDGDATDVVAESTAFLRRDEALVPLIVSGARKLKRVLADEQNGVLDLLRRNEPVTELAGVVPEIDRHVESYVEALADDLLDAAVAGAGEIGRNDTKTLRTSLRRGGALERAQGVLADDLVVPLRQRLERAIADGAGDNDDITKRVRAVYREWKTQHIDDQLDDAFRFAHGGGLSVGVKAGTPLTWTIDPSQPSCPDCEDNSLAGAVPAGDAFPTGHLGAPAHPGCRCLTLPDDQ